jgi:hypothetical protein
MKKSTLEALARPFEEVYKTAYSHGLESIYRLESVDIKTVRTLSSEVAPQLVEEPILPFKIDPKLDLGPAFSGYLEPFVLREPIQVLKLARHTEKCLLEQDLKTLGDLQRTDLSRLVYVKGMGQGHVQEVQEKLFSYTRGKETKGATSIDFGSWIRELVGDLEAKVAWVVLEPYQLVSEIALTSLESIEVKKLTVERKREIEAQAKERLAHPDKIKQVLDRFSEIGQVFVRPWIFSRSGVASIDEIEERLERVALDRSSARASLKFLWDHYKKGPFYFTLPNENGLYFSDAESWGRFKMIERAALSYFWSQDAEIPYSDLFHFLAKDFAARWEALQEKDFKKVISFSREFQRKRSQEGCLLIKRRVSYIL